MALDRSLKSYVGTNSADGIVVGLTATTPVAFFGGSPATQQSVGASATDAITAVALANNLRTALQNLGLAS